MTLDAAGSAADTPFLLELNPDEHVIYKIESKDAKELPIIDFVIRNPTPKHFLYKVKCTNNELFKIRPPVGILKANESVTVKLTLLQVPSNTEDDKHYFSVYCLETTDLDTKATEQWHQTAGAAEKPSRKRVFARFQQNADEKASAD